MSTEFLSIAESIFSANVVLDANGSGQTGPPTRVDRDRLVDGSRIGQRPSGILHEPRTRRASGSREPIRVRSNSTSSPRCHTPHFCNVGQIQTSEDLGQFFWCVLEDVEALGGGLA